MNTLRRACSGQLWYRRQHEWQLEQDHLRRWHEGLEKERSQWPSVYGRDRQGSYKRQCAICGETFYCYRPFRLYCSQECVNRADAKRRHEGRRRARGRSCAQCNRQFEPKRSDGMFCSGACRQAAYRRRHVTAMTFAQITTSADS